MKKREAHLTANATGAGAIEYETVAHAPLPPLRSEDRKRATMPIPSDAERPMPDTRRPVPRGSEGQ